MNNIYKAPEAPLTNGDGQGPHGSLEKAVAGDYELSIGAIINEAWERTKGNKATIWLALILYTLALVALMFVAGKISGYDPYQIEHDNFSLGAYGLYQLIVTVGAAPLATGLIMLGIKLVRSEPAAPTEVFAHFNKFLPLVVANLLITLLVYAGLFLLVLPGIYLAVAYMMALPLIADRGLGIWQAMEISRRAITTHWFAFFGLGIVLCLLILAASIPLLLGLIWVLPLAMLAMGIAYRNMFGGAEQTDT
ncbi:hypothetical protein [Microbulbifer sp. SAOS-129_SWC]|uniref:hypothetical protein n=1 Tax=Microbulbifer sp. SAOS-129_SWC TaxID=3145235 RepID=UPI003217B7F9